MPGFTEKEKEKQKGLIVFNFAENFISNLTAIMDTDEDNAWRYLPEKMSLSANKLTLRFELKESSIEKKVDELDRKQRKVDENYNDLDAIP